MRLKRLASVAVVVGVASGVWSSPSIVAAGSPAAVSHHATLGPMAQAAISASAHGRRLPKGWLQGRATKRGTTYGVFLRGTTTAKAIAATGAVPGTVLSVGATAEATLPELTALSALPGITEVELAGEATKQLDVSVPAIHASESGHASAASVPHLWGGTGGSTETDTGGGTVVWSAPAGGVCPGTMVAPSVFNGSVDSLDNSEINSFNAADGTAQRSELATFAAFDGTTSFFAYFDTLTAESSTGSVLWTWTAPDTLTPPVVVNHNVFTSTDGTLYALPAAGNGTATNVPTWTVNTGVQTQTLAIAAGNGYLAVASGSQLLVYADTVVTPSTDNATAFQIDPAHDGDQPNDSLTVPLATTPKWTANLGGTMAYPLIVNGIVYADVDPAGGSGNTMLYALALATGSTIWGPTDLGGNEANVNENFGITYDNGRVFSLNSTGLVAAFDATTGRAVWADQLTQDGSPTALDGVVYVGAAGQDSGAGRYDTISAVGESSGAVLWARDLATDRGISAPAVSASGVYVSTACTDVTDVSVGHVTQATPATFTGDTGAGTVVGVVDTGIDITNQDFMTSQGTRIVDLWDQVACPDIAFGSGGYSCPVQPPNSQGYTYGAECTASMINSGTCGFHPASQCCAGGFDYGATCEQPVGPAFPNFLPEEDCDGHGTHVAGIATSNGRAAPGGTYIGVAPEADLVAVKTSGDLADVIDGVAYIFKVAAARGEPASVNLSIGINEGPHDGSDLFEIMLDALTGPGKLVSVAAGNESTNDPTYHYHAGAAIGDGQVRTDGLLVQSMPVFVDIWYSGAASVSAAVSEAGVGQTAWVSPDNSGVSGEDGTCVQGSPGSDGFEDNAGNVFEILSCTHMPSNGMNEIQIALFNPSSNSAGEESLVDSQTGQVCSQTESCLNNFRILLRGDSASSAVYNAWTFDQGDYFFYGGDGNDNSTLDEPASAHDVISVGSEVTRNTWPSEAGNQSDSSVVGAISFFSGHGPTLDGRNGINIVAPGEEIGSSLSSAASPDLTSGCFAGTTQACISPDGNHLFLQGTSMAAPHVTGALALLLAQQPTIDVAQAKSLLAQSANSTPLTTGGAATTWGAGKLEVGPGVLSLTPASGPITGGNTLHITGVDLQAGVRMSLGGQALTLTSTGTNAYSAPVPAVTGAGAATLTITNPDGSTAVDPAAYVYLDPTEYHSLTPFRTCDTRSASTIPANQCKGKTLGALGTLTVQITGGAVPAGARSVVVNLTALNNSANGTYVSAYPAGHTPPRASNINLPSRGTGTNLAIVQLSAGGAITIFNAVGSIDVIVDVEGYFATPVGTGTVPGEFHSIPPLRICDTRAGGGTACAGATSTPLAGGTWRDVVVSGLPPGTGGGTPSIPSDGTAAAAAFNLTATQGTLGTYLAVAPPNSSDQCPSRPLASNVNPAAGATLPNRVISPLGPRHDVCVFNSVGSVNFIIDVDGWFGTGAETTPGALFNSIAPTRLCDTRAGTDTECSGTALGGNAARTIPIAGSGDVPDMSGTPPLAVVVNLTAVEGSASTYFTLYPGDIATHPRASDLNPLAGEVIANLSIVGIAQTGVESGEVSLYNAAGSINAILDAAGWFQ